MIIKLILLINLLIINVSAQEEGQSNGFKMNLAKGTTIITADKLVINKTKNEFTYYDNVILTNKDTILTCKKLLGEYTENNEIKYLTATNDVVIKKGKDIEATANKAVLNQEINILTLSQNPTFKNGNNIIYADQIKFFLDKETSIAKGSVSIKILNTENIKNQ